MSNEYLDLAALADVAEDLGGEDFEVESEDYSDREVMPVGDYLSQSRTITARVKDDGNIVFQIEFTGGLKPILNPTRTFAERFPLRYWVSTTPFTEEGHPGKTSSVAKYLKSAGFSSKGLTPQQLLESMQESQTVPIQVFVGWTDKSFKLEDGTYTEPLKLKTSAFNQGTKAEPRYVPAVTIEGQTYFAKPIVKSVRAVA